MENKTSWVKSFCAFDPQTQKCLSVIEAFIYEDQPKEYVLIEGNEPTYYNCNVVGRTVVTEDENPTALVLLAYEMGKRFEFHDTVGNVYPVNWDSSRVDFHKTSLNILIESLIYSQ